MREVRRLSELVCDINRLNLWHFLLLIWQGLVTSVLPSFCTVKSNPTGQLTQQQS